MSKTVKLFIISVCFIIATQFASLSFFVLVPIASAGTADSGFTPIDIRDKVVIPLGSFNDLGEAKLVNCTVQPPKTLTNPNPAVTKCWQIPWISKYIGNMYRYGVVIGAILAVVMIMIGGIMYLVGGMNPSMISRGKELIVGAVTGLALLLGSYVLLKTINPNLIKMSPIEVEIVKEQLLMQSNWCSETKNPGSAFAVDATKPSDKGTPGNAWETKDTCGETFSVTLANSDDPTKAAGGGQTCMSDYCPEPKACIEDPAGGKWTCMPVLMHGRITAPDKKTIGGLMTLLKCDAEKIMTDGFYVESVQVVVVNPDGSYRYSPLASREFYWPVTKSIDVKDKDYYFIEKKDLISPFDSGTAQDSWFVLLSVEVNDVSWTVLPTIDDDIIAGPKSVTMGAVDYEVAWTDVCRVGGINNIYTVQYESGKGIYHQISNPVTFGELKAGTKAIKWNINITDDFFDCKTADTVTKEVSCDDVSGGSLNRGVGEACSIPSDCKGGLYCLDNNTCGIRGGVGADCDGDNDCGCLATCSVGGATCSYDTSTPQCVNSGNCQCKKGLYCNTVTDKCDLTSASLGESCDPQLVTSCSAGLYCDDNDDVCVEAPPVCTSDYDCTPTINFGYVSGTCMGASAPKYCACTLPSDCATGFRCSDNTSALFQNADACVPIN